MAGETNFNYDNIFLNLLRRLADAMMLSLTFVLTCVPIFTIGCAFSSMYYTAMKGIKGDDGYIWKYYFKSFKQNFKQSTAMWLLLMVAFFVLTVDIWFWYNQWKNYDTNISKVLLVLSIILCTLGVMIFTYAFALQAKFDNKISVTLRNAFLMSIKNFPRTLLILLTYAVIVWCFYYDAVISVIVFVIVGFGGAGYLWAAIMLKSFAPYLPEEEVYADDMEFHISDEDAEDNVDEDLVDDVEKDKESDQ